MSQRFVVMDREDAEKRFPEGTDEYANYLSYRSSYNDYRYFLVDTKQNYIAFLDGGEPEDMTLTRNLGNLVDLLNKVSSEKD